MNDTQHRKQARPKTCSDQNICSSRCVFNYEPSKLNEQLVIPISSPILGNSAEVLKQHMTKIGNIKDRARGSARNSPSIIKDRRCDVRPKSSSELSIRNTSHGSSRSSPYHSNSDLSSLNQSEALPISHTSFRCVGVKRSGAIPVETNDRHSKLHLTTHTKSKHEPGISIAQRSNSKSSVSEGRKTNPPMMVSGSRTNLHCDPTPKCPSSPSIVTTSKNTEAIKGNTLKLNFKYTRQYLLPEKGSGNLPQRQKSDVEIICPSSSSASSFEDTAEVVYKFRRRIRNRKDMADFTKYIPVPIPLKLHVPKLLLNQMDEDEWNDAQAAYERDRVEYLKTSGSETRLEVEKDQILPGTPNKSVSCTPIKFSRSCTKKVTPSNSSHISVKDDNLPFDSFFCNYLKPQHGVPKRIDSRFDLDKAELLIESNSKIKPDFKCILYAGLPENPNFPLCHAMTELCVAAMLNFFHPYHDVQCLWIPDVQAKLVELLKDHSIKPKFTRLVYLRKFDAILVLSEDASNLLRHKDTCFLHSISSALKIQTHKLLVLCKDGINMNSILYGPYRPGTA